MSLLRVVKRQEPLGWGSCFVLAAAICISLLLSAIILYIGGTSPIEGIAVLFKGAFGNRYALEDAILKATPIFLCSLGVALAFKLQVWNIGAEGQFALGAVGATWMALSLPEAPAYVVLPLMILMAVVAGGLWARVSSGSPL